MMKDNAEEERSADKSGGDKATVDGDTVTDFDAGIEKGGVKFDESDVELLKAIDEKGSLNSASESLSRSYAHSHQRIDELETVFGKLVEREKGGAEGGGSTLTPNARDLLARYERVKTDFEGVAETDETVLEGTVSGMEGEIATVDTPAGRLRALIPRNPEKGQRVRVGVRADAVTLNRPEDTPGETNTSARNSFVGEVTEVEEGEEIVRVYLDVGVEIVALITRKSAERLGVEVGVELATSFKATATRGVPIDTAED